MYWQIAQGPAEGLTEGLAEGRAMKDQVIAHATCAAEYVFTSVCKRLHLRQTCLFTRADRETTSVHENRR